MTCRLRTTHTREQVKFLLSIWPKDRFAWCEKHQGWHRIKPPRRAAPAS